jgi:photosystem II stability/assembly factor-like uncharacterized protein
MFGMALKFKRLEKERTRIKPLHNVSSLACSLLFCIHLAGSAAAGQTHSTVTPEILNALKWRSIGPAVMGGRIDAVVGVPGNPNVIYVGHSSAGLYKSVNGGTTFTSIFDDEGTLSIGAVALSPGNPDVIYVGTGEGNPRNSASFGDGIYKSLDGGKSWKHLGLEKTERIARIVVNPQDPKIVLVAAMGHEWGPNQERGIYRSTDAGNTWKRVLFVNDTTGGSDVEFDPTNPNIVYAGMFDYLRRPWNLRSGGPGSGLYRSTDGGETWTSLTDPALKNELPSGVLGRVGVGVSASNPAVVYAFVPSKEGLLWRSSDGGESWKMVSKNPDINFRPFYFSQIRVDPADENRIYSLAGGLYLSIDGGKSFHPLQGGGDNHDMWIDPADPKRILLGSDMGFDISTDRGQTWDKLINLPFAQVYRVGFDMAEPYHVMAGLQDHEVWWGPNETWSRRGVMNDDWRRLVAWGDGQNAMADPRDPDIIYLNTHFGSIARLDRKPNSIRWITPSPVLEFGSGVGAFKYRFNWSAPLLISRHNPDVVYFGGNVLFRTKDGGDSWDIISPDLSGNDPEKMKSSGGPISEDNTNAEAYGTIFAISEDSRDPNVIWVGTDDGFVQVTRDGGKHWTNVTPNIQGLPSNSPVSSIDSAHNEPGRTYASFDRHTFDDFAPYVYVTSDFGKTWQRISDGLPSYVHVVREDPREANLLYAGTELGISASFDRGRTWADLRLGLPRLPVYDLQVHPRDNDLILGTHARGIYVLDDVTPLQQLAKAIPKTAELFAPMPVTRFAQAPGPSPLGKRIFMGPNQPYGALISYYLEGPEEGTKPKVEVEVLDSQGKLLRRVKGTDQQGINRVVWDLREEVPGEEWKDHDEEDDAEEEERSGYIMYSLELRGPQVLPGNYTVNLVVDGQKYSEPLTVRLDPQLKASAEGLSAQHDAVLRLVEMQKRAGTALSQVRSLSLQLDALGKRLKDNTVKGEATAFQKKLKDIEAELRNDQSGYRAPACLIEQIAYVRFLIDRFDGPPTVAQQNQINEDEKKLAEVLKRFGELSTHELANLNGRLRAAGFPYIAAERKIEGHD